MKLRTKLRQEERSKKIRIALDKKLLQHMGIKSNFNKKKLRRNPI
jgi:hypothetical protein